MALPLMNAQLSKDHFDLSQQFRLMRPAVSMVPIDVDAYVHCRAIAQSWQTQDGVRVRIDAVCERIPARESLP